MHGAAALPCPQPDLVQVVATRRTGCRGRLGWRAAGGRRLPDATHRRRQDGRATGTATRCRAPRSRHRGAAHGVRHRSRRCRACRARGRCVRRLRGPADDRDRARSARRAGRHVFPDRELPWFSRGCFRRRSRKSSSAAGAPAGRGDPRHAHAGADRRRITSCLPRRWRRDRGEDDHPRLRGLVAETRDRGLRATRREGDLIRCGAQRRAEHAWPRHPYRRSRELGGPGSAVLRHARAICDASSAAAAPWTRACRGI